LNTEKEIAPIVAQFVPVKLDIDTDDYRQWRQDHASEGSTIPKLFIVRSDGETLYGKSGSLPGDALPSMLLKALQHSGKIISADEAKTLTIAADRFEELTASGDIPGAIKALSKLNKLGTPGKFPSYATSAVRLNELVLQMADEVTTKLKEMSGKIEQAETSDKLQVILDYLNIRDEYGSLKLIKAELTAFQKQLSSEKEISQLYREAKILDAARTAKSKSAQARAAEKLRDLIAETEIEAVKLAAEKLLKDLESPIDPGKSLES
jgi:hypothetical protein